MPERNERSVLEAVLETSEVIADVLTDDQVLSGIPIIGTAIKALKAADSVRERAFVAKLLRFIAETNSKTEEKKKEYSEKLQANPDESRRVGETLFLVLEKLTDMEKPQLLGQVFVAYLEDVITAVELRRLSQAIDVAFMDDLAKFLAMKKLPVESKELWMELLVPSGLVRGVGGKKIGNIGEVFYEETPLGNQLRNAYFHGRRTNG